MFCSPYHFQSPAILKFSFALLLSLLLSACGTPGPGGDSPTQVDSELSCEGTEIDIIVRATSGILNDRSAQGFNWQQQLYQALTPTPAYALQGLSDINSLSISDISLVELDQDSRESSYQDISYTVKKASSSGYRLEFCDADGGFQPQANIVVKARLNQNVALYAPLHLTQGAVPIFVDLNSHYVVSRLFNKVSSAQQLEQLISTQASAKANLLRALYISTDAFDINFENNDNFNQALNRLRADDAYVLMVETGLSELLNNPPEPIAKGQLQGDNPSIGFETCFTDNRRYHTSYFRIGALDVLPNDSSKQLGISTAVSDIVPAGSISGSQIYPTLSRTSYLFTPFQLETLSPELPYHSKWLSFSNNNFRLDDSDYFSFFSAVRGNNNSQTGPLITDTVMSKQGNILFDRSIPAYIPFDSANTSKPRSRFGWSQNPVYSRMYEASAAVPSLNNQGDCELKLDQSPTWLTSAYYGSASRYDQGDNPGNGFNRNALQDQRELYTWEVHGLNTDERFSLQSIAGKSYGVISYALNLSSAAPQVGLSADIWRWDAATRMRQSQPSAHYQSYLLQRNSSTTTQFSELAPASQNLERAYFTVKENFGNNNTQITGLIGLDGGQQAAIGHSSQNGKYLAFVQDNDEQGRGLILASELRNSPPSFASLAQGGTRYLLQGNAFEMYNEGNVLRNITGSSLTFYPASANSSEACNANIELNLAHLSKFTFGTEAIPVSDESTLSALSTSCQINNGEITLGFDSLLQENERVELKGFMTDSAQADSQPGNLINFIWVEDNGLGLVFAQKLQDLNTQRR